MRIRVHQSCRFFAMLISSPAALILAATLIIYLTVVYQEIIESNSHNSIILFI